MAPKMIQPKEACAAQAAGEGGHGPIVPSI